RPADAPIKKPSPSYAGGYDTTEEAWNGSPSARTVSRRLPRRVFQCPARIRVRTIYTGGVAVKAHGPSKSLYARIGPQREPFYGLVSPQGDSEGGQRTRTSSLRSE